MAKAQGDFERGAAVACISPEGIEVARGLANYSSSDSRRIARRPSSEIEGILGYVEEAEIIYRDNLILN
jgi:glutamate 5-kinase